jgi:hypothetical protein
MHGNSHWLGLRSNTGDMVYTLRRERTAIATAAAACIGGLNKSILGLFTRTEVILYNSATGEKSAVIPNPYKMAFHTGSIVEGMGRNMRSWYIYGTVHFLFLLFFAFTPELPWSQLQACSSYNSHYVQVYPAVNLYYLN